MRPPEPLALTARLSALVLTLLVLPTAAIGWLYLLRPATANWPGPRVTDALPLDELALHQNVSVILFALATVVAAAGAGLIVRALHFDGFGISIAVGVGVGAWLYLATAISLYTVRQDTLDEAFDLAGNVKSVYATGVVFALFAAFFARRRSGALWIDRLLPSIVGLMGAMSVVSATLPRTRPVERILGGIFDGAATPAGRTIEIASGVLLIASSRSVARRSRRAYWLAVALLLATLVVRTFDNFGIPAELVVAAAFVGLVARRSAFAYAGDPTTRSAWAKRLVATALVLLAYGEFSLFVNRTAYDLSYNALPAAHWTFYYLLLGANRSAYLIGGGFAEWFPWTLRAIAIVGVASAVWSWAGPWRHRLADQTDRRRQARSLVEAYGSDTLAPFSLRADKAWFFYPGNPEEVPPTALVPYRVVRGVALVSGDPIGRPEDVGPAITAFRQRCQERGWRFALLGAGEQHLPVYAAQGLRCQYHGDEAVVDVAGFSLDGGHMKATRQAAHRVARKGYTAQIRGAGELDPTERAELAALEERWLEGGERKGFVMELDELFRSDGDDALFVVGRGPDGELLGFLEVAVCPASSSLSLSSMPRAHETPNGFNAFLIVRAIEWAREHDFRAFSLNFAPGARVFHAAEEGGDTSQRAAKRTLLVAKRLFGLQLDNLVRFNRQFAPSWRPRHIVFVRWRDLPRIVIAAMAAERYLPFADLLRGRDWAAPPTEPRGVPTA